MEQLHREMGEAEIERIKKGIAVGAFSIRSYCARMGVDRTSVTKWERQYNAGQFSRQFFDDDASYEAYMNRSETYDVEFFCSQINEALSRKFNGLSEHLLVVPLDGPEGPYQLVATKEFDYWMREIGAEVGEYAGEIIRQPFGAWYHSVRGIIGLSLLKNV